MTKKEFFDKYKTVWRMFRCSYCKKEDIDYLLPVGDWDNLAADYAVICEQCFMEVLND